MYKLKVVELGSRKIDMVDNNEDDIGQCRGISKAACELHNLMENVFDFNITGESGVVCVILDTVH